MNDLLKPCTLAEGFTKEFSKLDGTNGQVVKALDLLCTKYALRTRAPLLNDGMHIGVRYIFADASFCDFYNEAPTKVFTGEGSPAIDERKH